MLSIIRYCHRSILPFLTFAIPSALQYENYYDHTYEPKKDSLVWRLDYNKKSDFDDVSGHWHLEDHPSRPVSFR
jgi:hypothetical protein